MLKVLKTEGELAAKNTKPATYTVYHMAVYASIHCFKNDTGVSFCIIITSCTTYASQYKVLNVP